MNTSKRYTIPSIVFIISLVIISVLFYFIATADKEIDESDAASAARVTFNQTLELNTDILASPRFFNLDNSGKKELIIASRQSNQGHHGRVFVYRFDSQNRLQPMPGWPINVSGVADTPAIGDIDNNGSNEIVISTIGDITIRNINGTVYNFPQANIVCNNSGNTALADLDNNGDLEIIASCENELHVYNHDASRFAGNWPVVIRDSEVYFNSPAVSDIDGDGVKEIIVGTYKYGQNAQDNLYVLKPDGTNKPNFPKSIVANIFNGQTVADIDEDGIKEIIYNLTNMSSNSGALHVISGTNGTAKAGWPKQTSYSGNAIASVGNLDNNPGFEVIVGGFANLPGEQYTAGRFHAFLNNGTPIETINALKIPSTTNLTTSPILVDVTNDNIAEIFLYSLDVISGYKTDGTILNGFPITTTNSNYETKPSPVFDNLDTDSASEAAFISGTGKLIIKDNIGVSSNRQWPMFLHNNQNTSSM